MPRIKLSIKCIIEKCEGKYFGRALCNKHYNAWRRSQPGVQKKLTEQHKKHYLLNTEELKKYHKSWRKVNSNRINAWTSLYRAGKSKRIAKWANKKTIKEIYKRCPKGYHVDHIIPLRGVDVSGLHTQHNLWYIQARDNIRKNNKFSDESIAGIVGLLPSGEVAHLSKEGNIIMGLPNSLEGGESLT